MISFDPFLPKILARVEGAARPAVNDAIRTAIQEFCRRTRLWRETDTFQTNATDDGIMAAPYGTEIFEIENALFNERRLEPASISWLDDMKTGWRDYGEGQPCWITQVEPDTVRLVPKQAGTLDLALIIMPSDTGTQFPDWMGDKYRNIIADGALAELYALPNQPFTSPDLAMFHMQKFEQRLNGMSSDNIKGQQKARVRTKPHFF